MLILIQWVSTSVSFFFAKTTENGKFSNTFEESTALGLGENRAGDGAFSFFGLVMTQAIVFLCWQSLNSEGKRPLRQKLPLNCGTIVLLWDYR